MASGLLTRSQVHGEKNVAEEVESTFALTISPEFRKIWLLRTKSPRSAPQALDAAAKAGDDPLGTIKAVDAYYGKYGDYPSTAVMVYTMNSFVYRAMNLFLRQNDGTKMGQYAPYIYQLSAGLKAQSGYSPTVYRGMGLSDDQAQQYKTTKDVFFWPGFTSTSKDLKVARKFAKNTLFIIQIPPRFSYSAADISSLAVYKEEEILFGAYTCFRVLDYQHDPDSKDNIKYTITLIVEGTGCDLNGIWKKSGNGDGGDFLNDGVYSVSQFRTEVYWFGRQDDGASVDFGNIGYGAVNSSESSDDLSLQFLNLPISSSSSSGSLTLPIPADYRSMGNGKGRGWAKESNLILDVFKVNLDADKVTAFGLNGVWTGNNGGVYIVSKDPKSDQIGWIAKGPQSEWAHVAMGKVESSTITVKWGDLLIGSGPRRHGTLQCVIVSNDCIVMNLNSRKQSDPEFVTNVITRNRAPNALTVIVDDDEKKADEVNVDLNHEADEKLKEEIIILMNTEMEMATNSEHAHSGTSILQKIEKKVMKRHKLLHLYDQDATREAEEQFRYDPANTVPSNVKPIAVENLEELFKRMESKIKIGRGTLKAMGTGHSWCDPLLEVDTDGVLFDVSKGKGLTNIVTYDKLESLLNAKWRKKYEDGYMICAQSGCSYETVNQYLWPRTTPKGWVPNGNPTAVQRQTLKNSKTGKLYKLLPNQPGYAGLSLGGTLSVGAQGTGTCKSGDPRAASPGDAVRSVSIVIVKEGKVMRKQIESESDPVHDPVAWKKHYGDRYELIQDDAMFQGVIVSLGTVGVAVSFCLEVVDAYFLREDRELMTWDEFKTTGLKKVEAGIAEGTYLRWQLWMSPYRVSKWSMLAGKYKDSAPVLVMTYSLAEEGQIPPPVITLKNRGSAVNMAEALIGSIAINWVSKHLPALVPFLLMETLKLARNPKQPDGGRCVILDPFGGELGAAIHLPVDAVGNGVDYKEMIEAVEVFQKYSEDGIAKKKPYQEAIPGVTAVRFCPPTQQTLALNNGRATAWFESVCTDFTRLDKPILKQIGKLIGSPPNANAYLLGLNQMLSNRYGSRYNMGLQFDVKSQGANIWQNQKDQIESFVQNVYVPLTDENNPFANEFTAESGIDDLAQKFRK